MNEITQGPVMSRGDFTLLGTGQIAYVKPVIADGVRVFQIHTADGAEVTRVPSWEIAEAVVRQNDLEAVWVN